MWGIVPANSVFLWMLPLAGFPILFHLFLRVRKQVRPFPSLMFFLQAEPRLSARKRIREWLALLLRMLLIACLLLALSRPLWLGHGAGGPVSQVLLIDNSGSMSGSAPDGRDKLASALDAVSALIGDMGPRDTLAIVLLVDDLAAPIPEGLTQDKEALRASLGRIKGTHATGQPAAALAHAFSLLGTASTARREVHIITDAQDTEWARAPRDFLLPPAGTAITLHRIKTRPFENPNVSLGEVELPRRTLVAGRHYRAMVTLNNLSKQEAHVRVNSTDSGGQKQSQAEDIPPQNSRILSVPFETHASGSGWLTVDLENDAFEPDNHSCVTFVCAPGKKVLFCGPESDFGVVPLAVSPSGDGTLSGLVPVFKPVTTPLATVPGEAPVMVVLKGMTLFTQKTEALRLKTYLEQGGNVLILPGVAGVSEPQTVPSWVRIRFGKRVADEKGLPLMVLNKAEAVWDDLRNESGDVMLAPTRVFKALPVETTEEAIPLLSLQNGTPILARQRVLKGSLFVSGVDLDARSSTLPLKAAFVALIHGMALSGNNPTEGATTRVAGQRPSNLNDAEYLIRAMTGGVLEWRGPGRKAPVLARAGLYSVQTSNTTTCVAVRSAVDEGREVFLETDAVPALTGLNAGVDEYQDGDSLVGLVKRQRSGIDLFLPFLLLALLAALAEGWIVNPAALQIRKEPVKP